MPDKPGKETEPLKPYAEILQQEISTALAVHHRSPLGQALSAFSAGLDIGFSLLLMAVLLTLTGGVLPEPVTKILVANAYAIGFIFVVLGRSDLFTEHTTLAVLPVLEGRATVRSLLRLWGIVYAANLAGGAIFAAAAVVTGPALNVVTPAAFGKLGQDLVEHRWWTIMLSGTLAGWLMGLLSWLVAAGRDTISQVVVVWLVTTAIGLAGLHHSIIGSAEVLAAVFSSQGVSLTHYGHFLLWATLGNTIGGVFFVAIVKYSLVRAGQKHLKRPEPG